MTKFSKFSVSRFDFDSRCESSVFAEPVLEWNLIFDLQLKFFGETRCFFRFFKTFMYSTNSSSQYKFLESRGTVYQENVEHIRLTTFHWRCETVEMRRTCLQAQKLILSQVVSNSWKLHYDTEDTFTKHRTKGFPVIRRNEKVVLKT
jgi:hypothetical protein